MLKVETKQKCLNTDRAVVKGKVLAEIPAPFINGRYHFHLSRFLMMNGSTTDVFHSKPVYYHTKEKETRPLDEICIWAGNKNILLKKNPFDLDINFGYLSWLMRRQTLLGGFLKWNGLPQYIALNAVDTSYPDPHPETTTVDGVVAEGSQSLNWWSWSGLVNNSGDYGGDDYAEDDCIRIFANTGDGTDDWRSLIRSIFLFDTSGIGGSSMIDSAVFSVYGTEKGDGLSITPDINVYSSNPTSNTALDADDYSTLGSTAFSTAITYANYSVTGYMMLLTMNLVGQRMFIQTLDVILLNKQGQITTLN